MSCRFFPFAYAVQGHVGPILVPEYRREAALGEPLRTLEEIRG